MKRTILIALALLIIIIGGVYLAQRGAPQDAINPGATTGTTTEPTPTGGTTVIPDEGTVTLALGETAAFRGFLVTPTQVVEDSRCPAGVYCIQAGTVRVSIDINASMGTTTKVVKLGDSITIGNEKITFTSVDPLKTTNPIGSANYRFTVSVAKQ